MATTSPGNHSHSSGAPTGSTSGSTSTSRRQDEQDRIIEQREQQRRDEYGGFNWGADFFGWLVAVAVAVLLTGVVAAVAAAVGSQLSVTQNAAERAAGEIGIGSAIALLVVLMIGYFAGGYVAGRMSRYDGGRQGVGVWIIGLLVTIAVAVIGAVFGSQYDPLQQVNLPNLPIPTDAATAGGLIALAAVLIGTLVAAFLGGKLGTRYHKKVDRVGA
ncbi:MAG TPA: hypothetical protein VK365_00795 [Nocardioidaceae bacterium]|jgi:hypothetical protein|nr:hypothetical protein [Nocardioidaceae bacterium]